MNSNRKRKRGSKASSPFPFDQLPTELQKSVIEAAAEDDLPTALNLTLTSRATYSMVASSLYRKVFIGRPSSLKELQATLTSRPLLGRYVESLHFGPADGKRVEPYANHDHWPIQHHVSPDDPRRRGDMIGYISVSLTSRNDAALIPRWCDGEELEWPLKLFKTPTDCRLLAISDTLATIGRAIDVDLANEPYGLSKRNLSSVGTISTRLLLVC